MPVWLPLLKASLPYVTQIVATAIPAFTAKPAAEKTTEKTDDITAKQIAELQAAATQNAESIHILAEKLQQTIQGIEVAGNELQQQLIFFRRMAYASCAIALIATAVALTSFLF